MNLTSPLTQHTTQEDSIRSSKKRRVSYDENEIVSRKSDEEIEDEIEDEQEPEKKDWIHPYYL